MNQCIFVKAVTLYPGLSRVIADLSMSISYEYTKSLIKRIKFDQIFVTALST